MSSAIPGYNDPGVRAVGVDGDPVRAYSHMMRRSPEERERLKALVEGRDWSYIGHKTADLVSPVTDRDDT